MLISIRFQYITYTKKFSDRITDNLGEKNIQKCK